MADLFHEFARIYGKYGQQWTEDYRRDRGAGWEALMERPATAEEYNRLFLQYANTGHKVYAEFRNGRYSIWVKPVSVSGAGTVAVPPRHEVFEIFRKFTEIYRKHGMEWDNIFKKDMGKGWQRADTVKGDIDVEKKFMDYVNQGYMVHLEYPTGPITAPYYVIYIKKPAESVLETGKCRLEAVDGVKIREILMNYKAGRIDTIDAYEYIKYVVEKRR